MVGPPALPIRSASRRAIASAGPPGANGRTTLIDLALCDQASILGTSTRAAAAGTRAQVRNLRRGGVFVVSPGLRTLPPPPTTKTNTPPDVPPFFFTQLPPLGVKRTLAGLPLMSANDPKRTFPRQLILLRWCD